MNDECQMSNEGYPSPFGRGEGGEVCQQYLGKGRLVFLEGRLHTDRVEGKEKGDVHYFTKVILSQMQILDRRSGEPEEAEDAEVPEEPGLSE